MMRVAVEVLGTCVALALVASASRCSTAPWIDVRSQPLEVSSGEVIGPAPLVQSLPANTRGGPRRIGSVECAGIWNAEPTPAALRLRLRAAGAAEALCEATGSPGASSDRVRFELGDVALDPEVDYELELAPSGSTERVPFAPLLRPRARLGERVRGEGNGEPRIELELPLRSSAADLCGIALPLARCPGGWTEYELLDVAAENVVRRGALEVSPAAARTLLCTFDALPESRGVDYTLRVRFEQPHTARSGRRGTAHILMHGRPLERTPLGALRRGAEPLRAADLVLRISGPASALNGWPSARELTGLCLLVLAVVCAWVVAAVRPAPRPPAEG